MYFKNVKWKSFKALAYAAPVAYAVAVCADVTLGENVERPEPGSRGDTLTVVDKRMAYLVYNLIDSNGIIIGADLSRGAKLFGRNCRTCHGDDGRRINFDLQNHRYIGTTAHNEIPTFWFMMNFGDSVRGMLPYIDEIPLADMVDIAGFAQMLPQESWTSSEDPDLIQKLYRRVKQKKTNQK